MAGAQRQPSRTDWSSLRMNLRPHCIFPTASVETRLKRGVWVWKHAYVWRTEPRRGGPDTCLRANLTRKVILMQSPLNEMKSNLLFRVSPRTTFPQSRTSLVFGPLTLLYFDDPAPQTRRLHSASAGIFSPVQSPGRKRFDYGSGCWWLPALLLGIKNPPSSVAWP